MKIEIMPVLPKDINEVKRIYREAFPIAERKPFAILQKQIRDGSGEMCGVYADGELRGFFHTFFYNDYALLDYFAVSDKHRGEGIGHASLAQYCERYKDKKLFLEIEDHTAGTVQARRLEFYRGCGLVLTDVKVTLFGVPMELMTYKCDIDFETYHALYKSMLGTMLADKNVKSRNV